MTEIDPRELRNAFGNFMTGVTVVTTRDAAGAPVGFTANSFSSVSLDPPLLLVCPGKFLSSYDIFAKCPDFAVSVLAEGQDSISNTFASFKGDRFGQVAHQFDARGNPWIDGAVAQFSCTTDQVFEAGDHCILIGNVEAFAHTHSRGLGYVGGEYFSIGLERAALEQDAGTAICGAIIQQDDHVLLEKTPGGYRPPQITRRDRSNLRQDLCSDLAARGLSLRLGTAYSVFDTGQTNSVYYRATASCAPSSGPITAIPLHSLANLTYATKPIADMMVRFALECRTRSFSLYLGDAHSGDVHRLPERI